MHSLNGFQVSEKPQNTVRLQEVEGDEAPAIGTRYLQKRAHKKLNSSKRLDI